MPKKIPDVVHHENVSMKKTYVDHHRGCNVTHGPVQSSKPCIPETGDRIWAYSSSNKAWFYSIVAKYRPENGRIEVYCRSYATYGYDETFQNFEKRKEDQSLMKFWAAIWTSTRPNGLTAPGFEDVILEDFI